MSMLFNDVGTFHKKFRLPVAEGRPCRLLDLEVYQYRLDFMKEELSEFELAHGTGKLADAVDALVDLAWVVLGTAHYMGAPFNDAWMEVRRANMQKELAPAGTAHKRGTADVICKPEGWQAPDIRHVIAWHNQQLKHGFKEKNTDPPVQLQLLSDDGLMAAFSAEIRRRVNLWYDENDFSSDSPRMIKSMQACIAALDNLYIR